MTLSPEQIEEIAERERKATKGPWAVYNPSPAQYHANEPSIWRRKKTVSAPLADIPNGGIAVAMCDFHTNEIAEWNTAFIAHARADIPALLASHRELQERVDKLEKALRPFAEAAKFYQEGDIATLRVMDGSHHKASFIIAEAIREASRLLTTKGE